MLLGIWFYERHLKSAKLRLLYLISQLSEIHSLNHIYCILFQLSASIERKWNKLAHMFILYMIQEDDLPCHQHVFKEDPIWFKMLNFIILCYSRIEDLAGDLICPQGEQSGAVEWEYEDESGTEHWALGTP